MLYLCNVRLIKQNYYGYCYDLCFVLFVQLATASNEHDRTGTIISCYFNISSVIKDSPRFSLS